MDTPDRFYQKNTGVRFDHLDVKSQENQTPEHVVTHENAMGQQKTNGNNERKLGVSGLSKAEIRKVQYICI